MNIVSFIKCNNYERKLFLERSIAAALIEEFLQITYNYFIEDNRPVIYLDEI